MFFQKLESIKTEKQFKFMDEIIGLFDLWLATRPKSYKGFLTPEQFAESQEIMIDLSSKLFNEAEKLNIIEKRYVVTCPNCGRMIEIFDNPDDSIKFIIDYNNAEEECIECEKVKKITAKDVYIFYKLIDIPCKEEFLRSDIFKGTSNLNKKSKRTLRDEIIEKPKENIEKYGSEVVSEVLTVEDRASFFGIGN